MKVVWSLVTGNDVKLPIRLSKLIRSQVSVVLLILLIIAGSFLSDVFLSVQNFLNIMWAVSVLGIVALGQTMLIIACRFDMSVAYSVGLCGIVTVVFQSHGSSLIVSIIAGLLSGLGVGLINGLICVTTGANPFLVTLGTGTMIYAISLAITKSQTMYTTIESFSFLGQGKIFGNVNLSVAIFLFLAIFLEGILRFTKFGKSLYVLGANEKVGKLSGFSTSKIAMVAFLICGFTASIASLIVTSRNGSTVANVGIGMEFNSIIAVVLGGTSLFGGNGGALRTVVGVMVLGVLNNLLVLMNIPYEAQQIAKGVIFLLIVWLDMSGRKAL